MTMIKDVSLVIPAINSEKKIGYLLGYACRYFEDIVVGVDTRTTDATVEKCNNYGVRTVNITNSKDYAEHSVDQLFSQASCPWILRMDDDELFSPELVGFLGGVNNYCDYTMIGIHRKWCRVNHSGRLQWTAFPPIGFDWQFRLAQKDRITYVSRVHTPGIKIENVAFAPLDSFIVHLDYLYSPFEERLKKVENYDKMEPGMGKRTAFYYLWEKIPDADQFFVDLDQPELQTIVDRIRKEMDI